MAKAVEARSKKEASKSPRFKVKSKPFKPSTLDFRPTCNPQPATFLRRSSLWLLILLVLSLSTASAHATIVFGELATEPVAPAAGEAFTVTLEMLFPSDVPVEDAFVLADLRRGERTLAEARFGEDEPGTYTVRLELPEPGEYTLVLRDQTYRQEEAVASVPIALDGTPLFSETNRSIIFPPTETGSNSLTTWLIWLLVLPVAVGVIVTVVVLRSPAKPGAEA